MANRFPLIFNSGAGQIQELAASDNLDLTSSNLVNAGILFTSSGSATAPSLQIGSGTTYNPGLYSPGTDQLAVATNGTGRLFVDADGNINLGQASSALQSAGTGLTVYGASSSEIKFLNSTTGALATDGTALVATSTDFTINNREAGFILLGTSNTERLRITSTGALNFVGAGTAGSTQAVSFNGSAPVNSLVIDSSGRLGIGTSAPDAQVEILRTSTTNSSLRLRYSSTSYYGDHLMNPNGDYVVYAPASNGVTSGNLKLRAGLNFSISTNNASVFSPALIIDSSGNVCIGTSTVDEILRINGASDGAARLRIQNQGTTIAFLGSHLGIVGTGNANDLMLSTGGATNLTFGLGGSEKMRLTSTGLGIGTTTPTDAQLYVNSSAIYGVRINHATLPLQSFLVNGTQAFTIGANSGGGGAFYYGAGNAEAMCIDSSGRILVGMSTAPSVGNGQYAKVVIQGSNGAAGNAGSFSLQRDEAASSITSGEGIAYFNFNDNAGNTFGTIACEADANAGASDYPGRLVFFTTADGAASPTEAMRIKSTGIINFSNAPTHADNTAATAAGLAVGDVYKTVLGVLMIRF